MKGSLDLRFFAHSWRSDWNHGNAHFLRGLVSELSELGHKVTCYEPEAPWSYVNLLQEPNGRQSVSQFEHTFPQLQVATYDPTRIRELAHRELRGADVVVVHEWTAHEVIHELQNLKRQLGYNLLLHDTHHRAYTAPESIGVFRIQEFDGVLAFGEVLRQIYLHKFGAARVWTFHEAADTKRFCPKNADQPHELFWVGNWGDDERTQELQEFLIRPLSQLTSTRAVYGVRYPSSARVQLNQAGIEYRGYLPNLEAPNVYSRSALTLHIPRRSYANGLSGVPTIRMFEVLASGIPLICSPWSDTEGLFRPGEGYLTVSDSSAMLAEICHLLHDSAARAQLANNGVETIRRRHTCAHRAKQFEEICEELGR
jgi:spore maturation protein CgeB